MTKQQKKREPLLYIHQPVFQVPKGKMQETFSAKKAEERKRQLLMERELEKKSPAKSEEKKGKKSKKAFLDELNSETGIFGAPLKKKEELLTEEQVQKTIQEYDEKISEEKGNSHESSFKRVKPFREMNLTERLDYLENFPKQLPPVPCLFQTSVKAVRGFLKGKTDSHIQIRLFDKNETSIPIKELTDVKMIGLN